MNLIEELRWRGMIQDIMPGTEEQLNKETTSAYIGFDPTADSLHIGNLVPIILLCHLQRAGHKPYALIGGATGMIGDPSGKSAERNLLTEDILAKNIAGVQKQLAHFLSFDSAQPNAAVLVNNYDWFRDISFISFLRDTGKYITVNYMMAKDSVKKRIEGETGISYTEFAYQLMQGYDFYHLYTTANCKLQMGGSDQWGNITTGTELIRRKAGGEAFAFTCPLIKKADGGKFGKTESGNVWLDPARTSPYQFYQFWINASDDDVKKWIKLFTFLPQEEINQLTAAHERDPGARILQKKLAQELTIFVHGQQAYEDAIQTTEKLFAAQHADAESLSEEELENMAGVEKIPFVREVISNGIDIISFLVDSHILPSRGEARKMIQNNGISVNRRKVTAQDFFINDSLLLHGRFILLQKGKKNHYLIEVK